MEPLQKLFSVTLTYIFKVKIADSHQAVSADMPPLVWHLLSSCSCYNLRQIQTIHSSLPLEAARSHANALVTSRLDYCNGLYASLLHWSRPHQICFQFALFFEPFSLDMASGESKVQQFPQHISTEYSSILQWQTVNPTMTVDCLFEPRCPQTKTFSYWAIYIADQTIWKKLPAKRHNTS